MLVAGRLADQVFEPAMQPEGALAPLFGDLVGTGTGAGLGLLLVVTGLLIAMIGLSGYLIPVIRYAEDILPDHDASPVEPASVLLVEPEHLVPETP
jgi:hypothetical protein